MTSLSPSPVMVLTPLWGEAATTSALAQNGDGLRADQAGSVDDDDLHGLTSLVDAWRPNGFECACLDLAVHANNSLGCLSL
jgi:hypothetical protein